MEAFDDFIGTGFQLSYATYVRNFSVSQIRESCLYSKFPYYYAGSLFFLLRSPKVKIQAFNRLKNGEGKLLGFCIEYSVK